MRNPLFPPRSIPWSICLSALFLVTSSGRAAEPSKIIRSESLHPRINLVTWRSARLNKEKQFCIVFPRKYVAPDSTPPAKESPTGWPVLYFLHGRGRHERSLIDDEQTRAQLLNANFIVILPDGDDSWYIDSPVSETDQYESYLTELITLTTATYDLSPQPSDRAIGGWSMGGYGAMHYLVSHPEQFSTIVTLIGLVDFPRDGLPAGQSYDVPLARFGDNRDAWPAMNPLTKVAELRQHALFLLTAADAFDRTMNENFSRRLDELNISHRYEEIEGGHTFDVVRTGVARMIPFLNENLSTAGNSGSE